MIEKIYCSEAEKLMTVLQIFETAKNFDLPSGIALVVDSSNRLKGIVTEGDVRRAILSGDWFETQVGSIMNNDPIVFESSMSMNDILNEIPSQLRLRNRKSELVLNKIIIVDNHNIPVRVYDYHEMLDLRMARHRHVVVLGLGYVGLTLALVMADSGFYVTGVDVNNERIQSLRNGNSYIHELGLPELLNEQIGKNLHLETTLPANGDVYVIAVGTPIKKFEQSSISLIMSYLEEATKSIAKVLRKGNLVILRSTVPIGTCRNLVIPILENISGLKCGIDFHLSFAPERTAEGKALKELRTLPQIIGGFNYDSIEATAAVFRDLTPTLIRVDSLEVAEMAKLINNSFRDYIFAYANQMALIAEKFNINVNKVIKAANDGYVRDPVPFPSPGVGGPCLTKDPYIFAAVLEKFSLDQSLFIKGREINEKMHAHVYDSIVRELNKLNKNPKSCKILICGLAFKGYPETGDIRDSSSVDVAKLFIKNGISVSGYDAVADQEEVRSFNIQPVAIPEGFVGVDVVIFLNNHKSFEKINIYQMVRNMNDNPIVYDGWGIFRDEDIVSVKPSVYMGLSYVRSTIN
jgi:UDP-N-acetyl-D-mannosaminuronic acid dehydrogenase